MTIQMIPLNLLVASAANVRKIKTGVDELAASIAAVGVIQNLSVAARDDGKFEVVAGKRRHQAIRLLVRSKRWAKDTPIPCNVRALEEATTISLSENRQRVAMHPADAFRAFAKLESEGHDENAIAHQYGYDPREVRKLLSLGNLSPKVLNALAADKIDVATARAFTITDDHQRQNRILAKTRSAHEVRRMLTETKLATSSRAFRFVGADAYAAAGGTYTGDLFAQEGGNYADDAELVAALVDQKLATLESAARAEGWGEVIASVETPYESYQWHRIYPKEQATLSEADAAEVQRLGDRIEALMAELDDDTDPEEHEEVAQLAQQRTQIEERAGRCYSAEAKAKGVLVITIDQKGELSPTAYIKRLASSGHDGPRPPRALYNQKTTEELSKVRTAALQAEVFANPALARCVLIDALLPIVGQGYMTPAHAVLLRSTDRLKSDTASDINTREIRSPHDMMAPTLAQVPDNAAARFAWLLTLDAATLDRLQAYCTAALIDATTPKFAPPERISSADRIARAAGLDMREHWEGGIDFYDRLSRKALLAALGEAVGPEAKANCERMGKCDLAPAVTERIAGRGWLPPALRTPAEADEAAGDEAMQAERHAELAHIDNDDEGPGDHEDAYAATARLAEAA